MPRQMRRFDEAITAHPDAAGIFRDTDGYSEAIALNQPQNGSVHMGYMKRDTQLNAPRPPPRTR